MNTEEYYETEEEEEKKQSSWDRVPLLDNVSGRFRIIVATIIVLICYKLYTSSIDIKTALTYALLIAVFVWIVATRTSSKRLMDDDETKKILSKKLRQKQFLTNEIPPGEIRMDIISAVRWNGGVPYKRECLWWLIGRNGKRTAYTSEMDPYYPGYLFGTRIQEFGWTGHEAENIRYLPDKRVKYEMDREAFMSESRKRSQDWSRFGSKETFKI